MANKPNVNMQNVEKLTRVLRRLNAEETREQGRKEALELVREINPLELSIAEQQLIEEGVQAEDLRDLCTIHMEVLKDELNKLKSSVEVGHPLYTMIEEHDEILKFLTELDEVNRSVQKTEEYDPQNPGFAKLKELAEKILDAENHHLREENVLFPELEKRGISGPPRIMRMEHDDLRLRKHKIKELAQNVGNMDYDIFKKELNEAVQYLVFNLRDHIFKENHILYPSAFETLKEEGIWEKIKVDCDAIGYCSFTPKH